MHKCLCLVVGFLILAATPPADAAKRLGPPIEELQKNPERNRIVVAEAREKPEPGKILFAVSGRLSGNSTDEVLLRTDEATFSSVETGGSYILAWTDQRKNPRPTGGWEADPEGPRTLQTVGLGTTAVFEDTPELRLLFNPATMADTDSAGKQLDALLAQLQREDPRSRGLVITELYLRKDLTAMMVPAQVAVVQQVLREVGLEPQLRDLLLRTTLQLAPKLTAPWLAEELRHIIIRYGTQYDLTSFVPSLVRTAARGLQQVGEPEDIGLLDILLYSNNPGVAKAALAAMDHFDPGAAGYKAQQALERGWIHGETRLALQRYLAQPRP
jgi:hypothetical protein